MTGRHAMVPIRIHANTCGFGLIEAIVALTILAIALLGLAGAAAVAHRAFLGASAMERGAEIAAAAIDSLMREPDPSSGERTDPDAHVEWLVHDDTATVRIELSVTVGAGARARSLTFHAMHHAK